MATDYVIAWPSPSPLRGLDAAKSAEAARRKRHAPGLWSQRLIPGIPPEMPPDYKGAFSTCWGCPFRLCEKCPPNEAWTEFHARQVEAKTAHRSTLWQRMTGHKPQETTA
jgi:hypothetical protein